MNYRNIQRMQHTAMLVYAQLMTISVSARWTGTQDKDIAKRAVNAALALETEFEAIDKAYEQRDRVDIAQKIHTTDDTPT